MKRDIERERPRRINGLVERKRLGIEEEKLQNSRDFKEITFAITLFGGLLAFLFKLADYFNNNVLIMSGDSQVMIYITVWVTLIVLILLFLFLIFKWFLISTYESKLKIEFKNITQKLFGFTPLLIILWLITLFFNFFTYYYKDNMDRMNDVLIIIFVILIIVIIKEFFDYRTNLIKLLKSHFLEKTKHELFQPRKKHFEYILKFNNKISITILIFLLLGLLLLIPSYLVTGSYSMEKFPPSDANSDIITFTIKETGIPYSFNYITLNKLEADDKTFHYIDNVTINATHEKASENELMIGKNHDGIWYLNLNTSNLTSGNYMLHAEVTNDLTKKSIFGTIKKHDDILFYIPPKT
ncbi:MAG: hypothetical protein KAT05_03210, partial [Spirochaetes bacterium]|nr:hypothetical protein [Spirochaetota bacterium]